MRFPLNYFTKNKTLSYTFTIQEDKFALIFKDRFDRPIVSLPVSRENTSALFSRGSSESKRRTLLVINKAKLGLSLSMLEISSKIFCS
jgi:hypothetical protein